MKLKEYLDEEGIKHTRFAKKIGVSIPTMQNIIHNRHTRLSIDTALAIEEATRGKVKCKDLKTPTRS